MYVHFNMTMDTSRGLDSAVEVSAHVTYGSRGSRDEFGAPLEPDTETEVEIVSIFCPTSPSTGIWLNPKKISAEDLDRAQSLAIEYAPTMPWYNAIIQY